MPAGNTNFRDYVAAQTAPAPAPAPPPPTRTAAQHWQALYQQVEYLSPGAGQRLFERARAGRGRWTLDEFKGWFNYNYPSFSRAGKFFVLYVFYALYLALQEEDRIDSQSTLPPLRGLFEHGENVAVPCSDPKGSVVDTVFANAQTRQEHESSRTRA
ncbi:MAG: hypothetical protein CMB11_08415 [Euryarchaeota archaeon]|nr:hypothetical protein [Euryarchaeota archaeon]|tara:strand:- start:1607 stop:2077 length:471 start_codon:yes stop_codon:yes gene_type:complete